jgi:hypothetical protein
MKNETKQPSNVVAFTQQTGHVSHLSKSQKTLTAAAISEGEANGNVVLISNDLSHLGVNQNASSASPTFDDSKFRKTIGSLTAMELRKRYPHEANSHRNMLQRTCRIHVDKRLVSFRDFLLVMGPMPCPGCTVDRIDNDDPWYAPGKIAWADKTTQNNNKSDTKTFRHSKTKETFTTSQLAKRWGVSEAAIHRRFERGWTPDEIIDGKRLPKSFAHAVPESPVQQESKPVAVISPPDTSKFGQLWADLYFKRYKLKVTHLSAKQSKLLAHFAHYCRGDVRYTLEYVFENWYPVALAVEEAKCLNSSPDKPEIEFLATHPQAIVWAVPERPAWRKALDLYNPWQAAKDALRADPYDIDWQPFVDCVMFDCPDNVWFVNLKKVWALYKPCMQPEIFDWLPPRVQKAIASVDPDYEY